MVDAERHRVSMRRAIELDGEGQQALLAGELEAARRAFAAAAELYRESWEQAPPRSYGRLVGMLKSAVLADRGREEAAYVRNALGDEGADSPTASYAQALAALIGGDEDGARTWAAHMRRGSPAFGRTAEAIIALAGRDAGAYSEALAAITRDFEQRTEHLTGVAIADTALMLTRLAARRGLTADVRSPLLPQLAK